MKALFVKEFKQGRPLLFFAAGLALVIALGYAVAAHTGLTYPAPPDDLNMGVGWVIFLVPVALTFLAGAGLFAAEGDRGTMPVLLALPLSRRRIWLGKALAGLALAVMASVTVLGISALLAPRALAALPFSAYAPDLALWMVLAFGTALFSSALVSNTTSALGFSVILAGATAAGAACLVLYLGAPLLWNAEAQDVALWVAVTAPAFLLASSVAVRRGELLESWRRWRFAAPTFLVALLLSVFLVCGATRFATRYQRSAVDQAIGVGSSSTGPLALLAFGDPVRSIREPGRGWYAARPAWTGYERGRTTRHRRNYLVAVDRATGRELLTVRLPETDHPLGMVCSPDGRYAAVVRAQPGLTWGAWRGGRPILEVFDLEAHRRVYSGNLVRSPSDQSWPSLQGWSPSGKYLALGDQDAATQQILLLRPDGAVMTELPERIAEVRWSPTEDVLFGLDSAGALHRIAADGLSDTVIWSRAQREPEGVALIPAAPEVRYRAQGRPEDLVLLPVSPDGRWVLLYESQDLTPPDAPAEGQRQGETKLWAIPADGGEAVMLWRSDWATPRDGVREVWSADGKTLYLLQLTGRLSEWRPGMTAPQPTGVTLRLDGRYIVQTLARPGTDQLVVRMVRLKAEEPIEARTVVEAKFLLVDPAGTVRESPASSLAKDHFPLGFDTAGKMILGGGTRVIAADLDTGEVRTIYP